MKAKQPPKKTGRPPVWIGERREWAQAELCRRIADGETLRGVCRDPKMPGKDVFLQWLHEDASFAARYAQAREALADHWADEIIEIADDGTNDFVERDGKLTLNSEHVQRSRLRIDTRKWVMSKIVPRKYSERIELGGDLSVKTDKAELIAQAAALGLTKEQLFGG